MPAQTPTVGRAYYQEGDTAPNLRRQLLDGSGTPIDLTGATVTIDIAHSSYDYYYSPMRRIVEDASCIVETQTGATIGYVQYQPSPGDLSPPGNYGFRFKVTYGDGSIQHIPPHTYEPLIITTRVGGPAGA